MDVAKLWFIILYLCGCTAVGGEFVIVYRLCSYHSLLDISLSQPSLSSPLSLSLQLSVGRLHSVILTIKIPNIHSCRKVKVSLDETVGELIR